MKKLTETDLMVLDSILEACPTEKVERYLAPGASLADDLGLSRHEINLIGFTVEQELQYRGFPALTDEQILSWEKVQDIIDAVVGITAANSK
ncbi:hypothetical protein [Pedobacter steynii]|uniref:Acyl carrier protein n=1 Tax=Pedobacter steynii TaxID=430522 RepID=A0A1D7QMW9_9SPHI|nr:hypothetical protein [Pedobacter steynii]AOM80010.1 hypothetical protein BFS30_24325 [Pedobacter steynii]